MNLYDKIIFVLFKCIVLFNEFLNIRKLTHDYCLTLKIKTYLK